MIRTARFFDYVGRLSGSLEVEIRAMELFNSISIGDNEKREIVGHNVIGPVVERLKKTKNVELIKAAIGLFFSLANDYVPNLQRLKDAGA